MFRRMAMKPAIVVKPEFKMATETSFDQPLPFTVWIARRYHTVEMKGDLRKGVVIATRNSGTSAVFLDKLGRFSEEGVQEFRTDYADEFPEGKVVKVVYMVWYHNDALSSETAKQTCIDVGLVFKQMKGETEITTYYEDVLKELTSE